MENNLHRDRSIVPAIHLRCRHGDEPVEEKSCSDGGCRWSSWAAAVAVDCVALLCCPCAALSFLTLAFVKVPLMVGRKCIGRQRKRKKDAAKCEVSAGEGGDHWFVVGKDGSLTKERDETASFRVDDEARISVRAEAERVWLELYQIGHLGFGRVSFTGIP